MRVVGLLSCRGPQKVHQVGSNPGSHDHYRVSQKGMDKKRLDEATVPAPVLWLQYRYTSIIKCYLISAQEFEVDR